MVDLVRSVEQTQLKEKPAELRPGDMVRVHAKVVEGGRERTQVFEGVVMRLRKGGVGTNFTVRRISHGVGVERTFLLHSPRVEKIEVLRHGHTRRAQLYFLRGRTGKGARLKEKRLVVSGKAAPTEVETPGEAEAEEEAEQPEEAA
jgi:large subunit ribosomal protein L19